MTPPINPALAKLGIPAGTDFKKYAVKILDPLPAALQSKTYLRNLANGLTTTGGIRKRTSRYWPRAKS